MISKSDLLAYRAITFNTLPGKRLASPEEAVEFVNQRGFIFFYPIKGMPLPSLWVATAGDRPVPNEHDDPGQITWGWKDSLLGKRRWYYGRILRKRNTFLSMEMVPYFYALSENYGSPEEDYLIEYEQGRMTQETKAVYEALLKEGALDTISLRKAAHLTSQDSNTRFNNAIGELQAGFKILPIGIKEAGAWNYAFVYEAVHRHLPDLIEKAGAISEKKARETLAETYLRSVGAAKLSDVSRLFGWTADYTQNAVQPLIQSGRLLDHCSIEDQPGDYLALPDLVERVD